MIITQNGTFETRPNEIRQASLTKVLLVTFLKGNQEVMKSLHFSEGHVKPFQSENAVVLEGCTKKTKSVFVDTHYKNEMTRNKHGIKYSAS